ncbi:hypothetical protein CDD81_2339 [Ophiocordyceps australis]|uniref:Pseudouridine synthase n=1 Tax=Ophiocordyceps australis TaxID=1399860 RepID=A0A2C5XXV6_9HYPO|nr:hypothetical protein CDD81_2339 [Ophiocordyceps australis]
MAFTDATSAAPAAASTPTARPSKKKANKSPKSSRAPSADGSHDVVSPSYYFEDGLRRVRPYHWTFNTWCKERWRGHTLLEVFSSEFRDRPLDYYHESMKSGAIFVNGVCVGPDYVMQNGDLVSHTLHRHEPPVTSEPIGIIHEDDELIVINKPSGVPVHPAGRYKFNSLTEIMMAERGEGFTPHPCNRLDRLTSGIMFIAKNAPAAVTMSTKICQRSVRKEYVARVMGEFPDGEIVCDQPILSISPKLGLNRVRASGKPARTVFKKLAYYPPRDPCQRPPPAAQDESKPGLGKRGYSIVRCLPVTGRTHQLRVHLQFLGHPIQNDPIYANRRVWDLNLGESDADGSANPDEDVISRLSRMGKTEVAQAVVYYDEMIDKYERRHAELLTGEQCAECGTPLYSDPGEHELALWLHSLRYQDAEGKWSYTSPLPAWALPPEDVAGPTTVGGLEDLVHAVGDLDEAANNTEHEAVTPGARDAEQG